MIHMKYQALFSLKKKTVSAMTGVLSFFLQAEYASTVLSILLSRAQLFKALLA